MSLTHSQKPARFNAPVKLKLCNKRPLFKRLLINAALKIELLFEHSGRGSKLRLFMKEVRSQSFFLLSFSFHVTIKSSSNLIGLFWRVCSTVIEMSTVEDIQYSWIAISSVQWRDIVSTVEKVQYWRSVLMISLHRTDDVPPLYWTFCPVLMISFHCTENPPPYWWYSSIVLMMSLHCTEHCTLYWWYPSNVLKILHRTDDTPPLSWWCPSTVLVISLHCIEYPPLYCTDIIWGVNARHP